MKACSNKHCAHGGDPQPEDAFQLNQTDGRGKKFPGRRHRWCRDCMNTARQRNRVKDRERDSVARGARRDLDPDAQLKLLVERTRKAPLSVEGAADLLDVSPQRVRALIDEAKKRGLVLAIEGGHVGVPPAKEAEVEDATSIPAVIGVPVKVAVISDLHLGSKFCLREQLRDFVRWAHAEGAREVLVPGDVLDGCYRFARFEWSHSGVDEQTRDLYETLPALPGLRYHAITGNHDYTFTEASGVNVGRFIEGYFREHGRSDLKFYGDRGAYVRIGRTFVHLWHPGGGGSYARSYNLQKKVEAYAPGQKPHVLLAGHWHMYCHVFERGVHAFACPTFQGAGSAFSKSLKGSTSIGGMLLEWEATQHGTLRNFRHTYRAYFEREEVRDVFVGGVEGAP